MWYSQVEGVLQIVAGALLQNKRRHLTFAGCRHRGQFHLALLPGLVYAISWPSLRPSSWRPSSWGPPSSLRLFSLLPWLLPSLPYPGLLDRWDWWTAHCCSPLSAMNVRRCKDLIIHSAQPYQRAPQLTIEIGEPEKKFFLVPTDVGSPRPGRHPTHESHPAASTTGINAMVFGKNDRTENIIRLLNVIIHQEVLVFSPVFQLLLRLS